MVMSGQVFDSCVACLRSFSACIRMSAAFFRSASDSMVWFPPKTTFVIPGRAATAARVVPGVHLLRKLHEKMDCRVNPRRCGGSPGNDDQVGHRQAMISVFLRQAAPDAPAAQDRVDLGGDEEARAVLI